MIDVYSHAGRVPVIAIDTTREALVEDVSDRLEPAAIRRAYADGPFGQIHYASCGSGAPLLLLHQTPRSWDECAEIMRLLAGSRRSIAMDLPGMGASDAPPGEPSIELFADAAIALLDSLQLPAVDVFGHHTGAFVAAEMAAGHPERVGSVMLSAARWVDAAAIQALQEADHQPEVDNAVPVQSGAHLGELWRQRQAFYPAGRIDLLSAFIRDALRARDPRAGHLACARYPMDRALARITSPVLLIGHDMDPYTFGDLEQFTSRMPDARVEVIAGGMVPLEVHADRVAEAIDGFLGG